MNVQTNEMTEMKNEKKKIVLSSYNRQPAQSYRVWNVQMYIVDKTTN